MKRVVLFSIFFFTILLSAFSIESADSTVSIPQDTVDAERTRMLRQIASPRVKRSWYLVPIAMYQEETSVGFGISGGFYFKSNSLDKISSISGSLIYTLNNQAKLNLNPRFFLANDKVYLTGNFNIRYYPDHYYGIGNWDKPDDYLYTSENFQLKVEPFYLINDDLMVGLYLGMRGEKLLIGEETQAALPSIQAQYGAAGWDPFFVWGLGAQIAYDTRDNQFYPQKFSNFLKLSASTYQKALGSSYSFTNVNLDIRQYVPTWLGQVFAWQVFLDMNFGKEVPFQMLSTIGGSDRLRGFRERKFTDNSMFGVQLEYRIPIYARFKAVLFCSVGDVFDIYKPAIHKIKVGYGGGLRLRLNDARVHLRLDLAGNNYGEFKFYITAVEAF